MSRTLAIVVMAADARGAAAIELAGAAAALGREVAVLLQSEAVRLADSSGVATVLELGGRVSVCQTGLASAGRAAGSLRAGVEATGLVGFLADQKNAELLIG